jgi:hypothetical protein
VAPPDRAAIITGLRAAALSHLPRYLVSDDVGTFRELPFCPVAGIRGALRIPDAADAYRGIRIFGWLVLLGRSQACGCR